MNKIKEIIRITKGEPHIAYQRADELREAWINSKIWGSGRMPSVLFSIRQARDIANHYGLVVNYEGGLSKGGPWINWYVNYPKEKWVSEPKYQPAAHGQGITLGEAVVRCLLDCKAQELLGPEKQEEDMTPEYEYHRIAESEKHVIELEEALMTIAGIGGRGLKEGVNEKDFVKKVLLEECGISDTDGL